MARTGKKNDFFQKAFLFFILVSFLNFSSKKFELENLIPIIFSGIFFLIVYKKLNKKDDLWQLFFNSMNKKTATQSKPTINNEPKNFNQIMEGIFGQEIAQKITENLNENTGENFVKINDLGQVFNIKKAERLSRKRKYLQIALNGTLNDALKTINSLPVSEKIIVEAGTPLIKIHGANAVSAIKNRLPSAYIVADTKIADLAEREVLTFKNAGANAITALGVAPLETLNRFVMACKKNNLDAMIDMMNVPSAIEVLKKLSALPEVVILHRGVDETEKTKGKSIPYYQINQIKGQYNLIVSVAGGDTPKEIQSAIFNGANIVVVWKNFETGQSVNDLATSFLKEIK